MDAQSLEIFLLLLVALYRGTVVSRLLKSAVETNFLAGAYSMPARCIVIRRPEKIEVKSSTEIRKFWVEPY